MSESESKKDKDQMTGEELRQDALENGFVMDDTPTIDDPLAEPTEKKKDDSDGNADQ